MKQIETFKGSTGDLGQLEQLVNDFLIQYGGRVKDVITGETTHSYAIGEEVTIIVVVVEYDAPLKDWQAYFNYMATHMQSHQDLLKAFLKTNAVFTSNETLDKLANIYETVNIVADLCEHNGIEYKEDK